MPYSKRKNDDGQWCVYKEGEEKSLGCYDSESDADDQIAAIHATEDKSLNEKYATRYTQKEVNYTPDYMGEDGHCAGCRWFSAHSDYDGCAIIQNYPQDVLATGRCDKWEAIPTTESDPMPVMIVAGTASKKDDIASDVGTVEVPKGIRRLLLTFEKVAESAIETARKVIEPEPFFTSLKIKGNHWLITWSNNFEDHDGEIFTLKAIQNYVARTKMGLIPMPTLQVWHAGEKTQLGTADWVADYGHFISAAGQFDQTSKAQHAKGYYKRNAHKTAVSHGYTFRKSAFDGKHYHEFNTFEISLLPRGVEANSYTSLERIKAMAFSEAQEKYLAEVFGDEDVKQIKTAYEERGKVLEELGVQFKDFTNPSPDDNTASKEAVENVESDFKSLIPTLIQDSAAVVKMMDAVAKSIEQRVKDLQTQLDSVTGELATVQEAYDLRPKSAVRGTADAAPVDDPLLKVADKVARDEQLEQAMPGLFKKE